MQAIHGSLGMPQKYLSGCADVSLVESFRREARCSGIDFHCTTVQESVEKTQKQPRRLKGLVAGAYAF